MSHKPLDLVASGRRMPGAAGNPPGGMHPGQGILGLSALTIFPPHYPSSSSKAKHLRNYVSKPWFPLSLPQGQSIYLLVIEKFRLSSQKCSVEAITTALGRSRS